MPYRAEIDRIIGDLFGLQTAVAMKGKGMKKEKVMVQPSTPPAAKPVKAKGGFKLPFGKKRGEF